MDEITCDPRDVIERGTVLPVSCPDCPAWYNAKKVKCPNCNSENPYCTAERTLRRESETRVIGFPPYDDADGAWEDQNRYKWAQLPNRTVLVKLWMALASKRYAWVELESERFKENPNPARPV